MEEPSDYVQKQIEHLNETRKMVKENETKYFELNEKYLKGRPMCTFELDDTVYIKSLTPTTSFMPKNLGLYVVIGKTRNDNYILRDANDDTAKVIKLHVTKLYKGN